MNSSSLLFPLGILLLFSSCSQSPSDPESFGEAVLQTFIEEDYDSFQEMTAPELSRSQLEDVLEELSERKLSHLEEQLKEAKEDEQKENLQKQIDKIKEQLEDSSLLEMEAAKVFLKMSSGELDYDEWKELSEEVQQHRIKEFEKGILEKEREDDAEDLSWEKDFLKELKASSFDNSAFNKWKEKKEELKKKWKDSFDGVIKNGKSTGINWEDIKFEYVDFDKEKLSHDDEDITVVFSYREESYKIELDDCLQTSLGIIMGGMPKWRGSFDK